MSIYALNLAFKADIANSSTKFVFVALADYANEEMEIYPTIESIIWKTSLNKKTILLAIEKLINCGVLVDTGQKKGKTKQTKVYKIDIERVPILEQYQKRNSSNFSNKESQKRDSLRVPKTVHRTINNITTIEPPLTPISPLPDWMPLDAWEGYCKHRGKSFTNHAKELAIKKLDAFRNNGFNPREILENSIMNGWKGLFQPQSKVQTNAKVINSPAKYIPGHQQPDGKAFQAAAAVGRAIEILNDEFRDFDENNGGNKSRS